MLICYLYMCLLFDQLSIRHDNTRSSTKLGVEVLYKKRKRLFLSFSVLHFSVRYFTGLRDDVLKVFNLIRLKRGKLESSEI